MYRCSCWEKHEVQLLWKHCSELGVTIEICAVYKPLARCLLDYLIMEGIIYKGNRFHRYLHIIVISNMADKTGDIVEDWALYGYLRLTWNGYGKTIAPIP